MLKCGKNIIMTKKFYYILLKKKESSSWKQLCKKFTIK